jgi:precorrin-6y C5,15-methyltransferase (decarboxylating) CbiE subunit
MEVNVPRRIRIVGAGPGAPEYFTLAGRRAVQQSDVLIGSQRLLDLLPDHRGRVVAGPGVESSLAAIESCGPEQQVAVLVSGDAGLLSLARFVVARFGRAACEVIPGVSALQVAFARVALDWSDARIVDAHGGSPERPAAALASEAKAAVFLGSARAEDWLADLAGALGSTHSFVACSHLTTAEETVREVAPQDLRLLVAAPMTVLLVLRKDVWP